MTAHGCQISTAYISQLRTGARSNPSDDVVASLAKHSGVPTGYFFTTPWHGERDTACNEDAKTVAGLNDSI